MTLRVLMSSLVNILCFDMQASQGLRGRRCQVHVFDECLLFLGVLMMRDSCK